MTRHRFLLVVLFGLFLSFTTRDASADGMVLTGTALRTKSIGFVNYKLYVISHYIAEKPATKSKQACIDADVNKQFVWKLRNTLPSEKVKKALSEAFAQNGYTDQGKIGQFLGAFSGEELKEDSTLTINYNATSKAVTVAVPGGKTVTVPGADFMKGVWSIWFGKIDQNIGESLIANL